MIPFLSIVINSTDGNRWSAVNEIVGGTFMKSPGSTRGLELSGKAVVRIACL